VTPVLACPASGALGAPVATGSLPAVDVTPAPAATEIGRWRGRWTRIARAPIAPRSAAATDVTRHGERLLVFSGRDADGALLWDGATYDVRTDRWYPLPDVPLTPRTGFAFETGGTGSMFLWGGVTEDGTPMADGAYVWARRDVGRGSPRVVLVPEAPLTPGPASAAGDLNNWLYVVTAGEAITDPPRFAYMAGSDEGWRAPSLPPDQGELPLDAPPVPAGIGYEVTDDPTVLSYQADGTAVTSGWYVLDGWTDPVVLPLPAAGGTCPTLDQGEPGWIREAATGTVGLTLDDGWGFTATPPVPAAGAGMLVQSPTRLILADALVAWDGAMGRWLRLPALPGGPRTGVSAMWAYGSLVVWGGRSVDGSLPVAGWRFTPDLPPDTFSLPNNGRHTGDCGGTGIDDRIRLRADRDDPQLVWFEGREGRYTVTWPDGWVVRFGVRPVVLDEQGRVVAREGERLRDIEREPFCTSNQSISF